MLARHEKCAVVDFYNDPSPTSKIVTIRTARYYVGVGRVSRLELKHNSECDTLIYALL